MGLLGRGLLDLGHTTCPPLSCIVSSDILSSILKMRRTWAKSEMPMVAVSPSTFTHSWELLYLSPCSTANAPGVSVSVKISFDSQQNKVHASKRAGKRGHVHISVPCAHRIG